MDSFVEDSANFDEGSNNQENYLHVNHQANQVSETNGTAILEIPETWDGEDMKAVLLIDWEIEKEGGNGFHDSLPGIGTATLLSLLAAVPLVRSFPDTNDGNSEPYSSAGSRTPSEHCRCSVM